jgi:hypothetical protein
MAYDENDRRAIPLPELLTTIEAAAYLKIDPGTLDNYRSQQIGPDFIKVGHLVRYRPEDLETWLRSRTVKPKNNPPYFESI